MADTIKDNIKSRKIAILAANGVDAASLNTVKSAILSAGGVVHVISPVLGAVIAADDQAIGVLESTYFSKYLPEDLSDDQVLKQGLVLGADAAKLASQFIMAISRHRFWEREKTRQVPA